MSSTEDMKIKKMSVKDMLQYVSFQSKGFWQIKVLIVIGTISGAIIAYVNSFIYAGLLNSLIEKRYEQARAISVKLVLIVMVLGLISVIAKSIYEISSVGSSLNTEKRTDQKSFLIAYEKLEDKTTLQKIQRIKNAEMGSGGINEQLSWIYKFFQYLFSVIFASIFVIFLIMRSDLKKEDIAVFAVSTIVLLATSAGVTYACTILSRKIGEEQVRMSRKNEETNSLGQYLCALIDDEEYSPDKILYGLKDYLCKKGSVFGTIGREYKLFGRKIGKLDATATMLFEVIASVTYVYCTLKAIAGSITTGEVLMYAGAVITMMESIREMIQTYTRINYANEYLKTYEEFIEDKDMDYDGTLPIEKRIDNEYNLEIKNVSFKYPDTEEYILKNINLKLKIGERLALVGMNGAGKTTLIKILLRLYEPTEGEILLNGINIRLYDYREYMKIFSVVFQDYQLFDFPLDENISGSSDPDKERVRDAMDKMRIMDRVDSMKNGIHTSLNHEIEDGESLSGGEAQKIAIARALYKDAPFVILDEPTAALDPLSEAEIYENFRELVGGKTSIYISHRMSSCRFCDRIVVMDNGEIKEQGTHDELMNLGGTYEKLFSTQARYYKNKTA